MKKNLDVLVSLDAYAETYFKANSCLKSTLWNINKARRQKDVLGVGMSYSALDVRHEIRARVRVECDQEPQLEDEFTVSVTELDKETKITTPSFKLCTVNSDMFKPDSDVKMQQDSDENNGLRRRKGQKDETTTSKSSWFEEHCAEIEEKKLHRMDPIDLFGALPPKELKLAQNDAKKVIELYIDAANQAVEILKLLESK